MLGLIYDIQRFALHDGPGIRTTVFFKGCPLDCWWCHNPESRKAVIQKSTREKILDGKIHHTEITTGKKVSVDDLMDEMRKEKVFMDESGGGVTLSGGEPLLQHDFALNFLNALKKENYHSALDTTGYSNQETFKNVASVADLILFDLKHMDDIVHRKYTGVSNSIILDNLKLLFKMKSKVIIRYPFIPGLNDGNNLDAMISFLEKDCPDFREIHILPFHNIASHKYRQFNMPNRMESYPEPRSEQTDEVKSIFESRGYHVKIGG